MQAVEHAQHGFWPDTADGWLAFFGRLLAGAIVGAGVVWRFLVFDQKRLERKHDDDMVKVGEERAKAIAMLRAETAEAIVREVKDREALRVEIRRDLQDEADDRKLDVSRLTERAEEFARVLHNLGGDLKLLTDETRKNQLQEVKQFADLRIEIERGFAQMRELLHNCPYRQDHQQT